METGVLFVLAAFAFTVLAAGIEFWLARRTRRELAQKASLPLHPLTRREEVPRVRSSSARRWLRYLGLFVGFLIASYMGVAVVRVVYRLLEAWL